MHAPLTNNHATFPSTIKRASHIYFTLPQATLYVVDTPITTSAKVAFFFAQGGALLPYESLSELLRSEPQVRGVGHGRRTSCNGSSWQALLPCIEPAAA